MNSLDRYDDLLEIRHEMHGLESRRLMRAEVLQDELGQKLKEELDYESRN